VRDQTFTARTFDYANGQPKFDVPDASYDRTKSAASLGTYKDIRIIPAQLLNSTPNRRTDIDAAFFYAANQEEKDRYDMYVSMGLFRQVA